jgi:hypothetical protein
MMSESIALTTSLGSRPFFRNVSAVIWPPRLQAHAGVTQGERLDRREQGIAGVQVAGRDRQAATLLPAVFRGDAADVLGLVERAPGRRQDGTARLGQPGDAVLAPREQLHAQLALEQLHLAAHPGLGGMKRRGGTGKVVRLARDLAQDAQLVEGHGPSIAKSYQNSMM